ncbi:MAG: hypothetical protein EAZ16_05475 [Sphingobacteriales bacterium]|nr:MAG: hypothetical protein EAZ16_05475 [Sphingobacteriales bacterium]
MLYPIFIIAVIACSITAIIFFILYARARMQEREQDEKKYLSCHYIALFALFALGILYMLYMVVYTTD